MDTGKLKDNFALVGANGVDVADYFYADLFAREPQLRSMFPAAMARQHEVLLAALSQIVSSVDDTDALVPFLRDLGGATTASAWSPTTTRPSAPACSPPSPTSAAPRGRGPRTRLGGRLRTRRQGHVGGRGRARLLTRMDTQRLKDSFDRVAGEGDAVALFFYSDLFVRNPHLRDMFPIGMSGQRDKLLRALGHIVSRVDDLPALVPFLQQLGRDHRRFGIVAEHYPHVGPASSPPCGTSPGRPGPTRSRATGTPPTASSPR